MYSISNITKRIEDKKREILVGTAPLLYYIDLNNKNRPTTKFKSKDFVSSAAAAESYKKFSFFRQRRKRMKRIKSKKKKDEKLFPVSPFI